MVPPIEYHPKQNHSRITRCTRIQQPLMKSNLEFCTDLMSKHWFHRLPAAMAYSITPETKLKISATYKGMFNKSHRPMETSHNSTLSMASDIMSEQLLKLNMSFTSKITRPQTTIGNRWGTNLRNLKTLIKDTFVPAHCEDLQCRESAETVPHRLNHDHKFTATC